MNKCNECSHININTKFNYIPVCVSSLVVYVLNCEVSFARLRATYDLKEYIFYVLHDRYASCHRVNSKACCTRYVRNCEVSYARLRATYDLKEYIFYVLHDRYASRHRLNSKASCTKYVHGIRTRSRSCAAGR